MLFVFSIISQHTSCALVTGVQTCALPICADFAPRRTEPVGGDHAVDAHRRARRSPYDLDPRDRRLDADRWIEIERGARVDHPRARKIVAPRDRKSTRMKSSH